jgi:3'(2'), 5'-bisphosphate nucleotidase
MIDLSSSLPIVLALAREAAHAISTIYRQPIDEQGIQYKADNSPLSLADQIAQSIIVEGLMTHFPAIPIISEEHSFPEYDLRKNWSAYWLVDPLDGTKEFVGRTGEFTVNIAFIVDGVPILGVIYAPEQETLYWGCSLGAFKQIEGELPEPIRVERRSAAETLRILSSRRHGLEGLRQHLPRLQQATLCSVGSSLKFCWLAEGKADFYPRFGPTSEWDTAAGQCILESAGGCVVSLQGGALRYNQQANIVQEPFFACANPNLVQYLLSLCV